MTLRVLQLTDFHIFSDPEKNFFGIPTYYTLKDILQKISDLKIKFDYMIITGDLTSDETIESYQNVKKILGNYVSKSLIIPGNHDDRNFIREVFPECIQTTSGPINFSVSTDSWELIGIDTHLPGELYGYMSSETIPWLKNLLDNNLEKSIVIFLHHPPFPVQSRWVDTLKLKNSLEFFDIIKNYPNIRIISCGHVHQEFSGVYENISLLTSPSTGLQFKKGSDMLECESLAPGFRLFQLDENMWNTEIIRLEKIKYIPEMNDP